jgi:hypothetical protein
VQKIGERCAQEHRDHDDDGAQDGDLPQPDAQRRGQRRRRPEVAHRHLACHRRLQGQAGDGEDEIERGQPRKRAVAVAEDARGEDREHEPQADRDHVRGRQSGSLDRLRLAQDRQRLAPRRRSQASRRGLGRAPGHGGASYRVWPPRFG